MFADKHEIAHLDVRSLSLMRLCFGAIYVWTNLERLTRVTAHYSDYGIWPRPKIVVGSLLYNPWAFISPHLFSGDWHVEFALFLVSALLGLLLLLGFKTKWVTPICWFLECSAQMRNPLVTNVGDAAFRLVLFWSMFLPWGDRFSLDSRGKKQGPNTLKSWWGVGYMVQVTAIYFFAGWSKTGSEWAHDGTAASLILSHELFTTSFGSTLLRFPRFLEISTYAVVWFERLVALLFWCPWRTDLTRLTAVISASILHVCMALSIHLGAIPWVFVSALVGLVPAAVWELIPRSSSDLRRFESSSLFRIPLQNLCLSALAPVLLIGSTLAYNIALPLRIIRDPLLLVGKWASLKQSWIMYAPSPTNRNGWFVFPGTLQDGRKIDLFQGGTALNWEKPKSLSPVYRGASWLNYFEHTVYWYAEKQPQKYYPDFAEYICRTWNRDHHGGSRLSSLEFVYVLTPTNSSEKQILSLWKQHCELE
jgi:hypothetical protein